MQRKDCCGVTILEFAIETIDLFKVFEVRNDGSGLLDRILRRDDSQSVVAVDHVNLKIREGEIFGLLGPNGSGKTTIVKMLCTVVTPTSGKVLVNGVDAQKDSLGARKQMGVMINSGRKSIRHRLSAWDNLEFYGALYGLSREKRRERIEYLLDYFGLRQRGHDQVQRFSAGMQRQLTMCKVLLPDAPILLLDEPTVELDVETRRKIGKMLKKVNREQNKTILLTTHHLSEAERLCDRVAIIRHGRVVICESPQILKDKTKEDTLENAYKSIVDGLETPHVYNTDHRA